jgi:alpha-1,3-rhamnosyl/mannosyltransferase
MRILVDGKTLCGQRTGIGWYTHRLLLALAAQREIEAVGVAVGSQIVSLEDVGQLPASWPARSAGVVQRLARGLRYIASDMVPWAREMVTRAHVFRLAPRCGDWTLFHQPNYVSPPLPLPLVTTVCDMSYVACPQWLPRERRLWLARSLGPSLERSQAIVTISQFTRDELLAQFPRLDASRVFATPLGVDHGRFQPTPADADEALHARLNLPPRVVLYLGTLEPRKNLQGLRPPNAH